MDESVFIGSTELCHKIKDKVLTELFDHQYENNSLEPIYNKTNLKEEYTLIDRLELINLTICQKLKELKKKEEENKLNESKKMKEVNKIDYFTKKVLNGK